MMSVKLNSKNWMRFLRLKMSLLKSKKSKKVRFSYFKHHYNNHQFTIYNQLVNLKIVMKIILIVFKCSKISKNPTYLIFPKISFKKN